MPITDIAIEAGHIYAPNQVFDQSVGEGLRIGRELREKLLQKGLSIQQVLFVDDVSPREKQRLSEDYGRWELFIQRSIQQILNSEKDIPFQLYEEYQFIHQALAKIEEIKNSVLKDSEARLSSNGKAVILGSGKSRESIRLIGYSKEFPELPSCEILDLCVYLEKLQNSQETITVLPREYEGQQERVHKLFQFLKINSPVTIIFYDKEGKIVEMKQWHLQQTTTSQTIKEVALSV